MIWIVFPVHVDFAFELAVLVENSHEVVIGVLKLLGSKKCLFVNQFICAVIRSMIAEQSCDLRWWVARRHCVSESQQHLLEGCGAIYIGFLIDHGGDRLIRWHYVKMSSGSDSREGRTPQQRVKFTRIYMEGGQFLRYPIKGCLVDLSAQLLQICQRVRDHFVNVLPRRKGTRVESANWYIDLIQIYSGTLEQAPLDKSCRQAACGAGFGCAREYKNLG